MKTAVATIKGLAPIQFSKYIATPRNDKESAQAHEERTWQERMHINPKTKKLFIPGMAFKKSLDAVAKFLGDKIQGKRNATWTKHFLSGVLPSGNAELDVAPDKAEKYPLFVPSDGKPGGGSRVLKFFPIVREWATEISFMIIDDEITQDVFKRHLEQAGQLIGVLAFRPEHGGYFGRFEVEKLVWK